MTKNSDTLDHLYKKNFAKMVIALAKFAGLHDLATAEDIVQEAFIEASEQWKRTVPDHPESWLYRVCRNIAFKNLRDGKLQKNVSLYESENTIRLQVEQLFNDNNEDDQLKMLYSCVHPNFAAKSQVIFALRYVAGFRIEQIATVLAMQSEAVTKTLLRMRDTIRKEKLTFRAGNLRRAGHKTPIALKVLYLMFSEGYNSSRGKSLLNLELCEDALSLTQTVVSSPELTCAEAEGLLSLILFSLSRFEARFNEKGELVDLENQDRRRWNRELTRVAEYHLNRAKAATYGTWHLEAAIAYLHSTASTFNDTDWTKISLIYDHILATNDSPFTRLNQAIAIFYSGDMDRALAAMAMLGQSAIMQQYHLYHVAMGKIFLRTGDRPLAHKHFERAIALTGHEVEKEFIRKLV